MSRIKMTKLNMSLMTLFQQETGRERAEAELLRNWRIKQAKKSTRWDSFSSMKDFVQERLGLSGHILKVDINAMPWAQPNRCHKNSMLACQNDEGTSMVSCWYIKPDETWGFVAIYHSIINFRGEYADLTPWTEEEKMTGKAPPFRYIVLEPRFKATDVARGGMRPVLHPCVTREFLEKYCPILENRPETHFEDLL